MKFERCLFLFGRTNDPRVPFSVSGLRALADGRPLEPIIYKWYLLARRLEIAAAAVIARRRQDQKIICVLITGSDAAEFHSGTDQGGGRKI
jgi:hypothetical protein